MTDITRMIFIQQKQYKPIEHKQQYEKKRTSRSSANNIAV